MTVTNLKTMEGKVKCILEKYAQAREDKNFFIFAYLKEFEHQALGLTMEQYLTARDLPSFESITRVRRKVQEKYLNLASKKTIEQKAKEQEPYRLYAKEA